MAESSSCSAARPSRGWRARLRLLAPAVAVVAFALATAIPASAGQASSGQLFFYPCTQCHPVTMVPGPGGVEVPSHPLPNGMTGHKIVLEGHDALGTPDDQGIACLACHDEPTRNPGKLRIVGDAFIDIKGDVSQVCYKCHSTKYKEFKAGTHGKHQASCVAAGCHDPHTPQYIYAPPLLPFVGTGFQFKVLPVRQPFTPLAAPAPAPAVETPTWFLIAALVGLAAALGLIGLLVIERPKR